MRLPFVLVTLLAVALSLVNVSAYKQSTVTNPASVQVDTTGNAALGLSPSPTSPMATVSGRMLRIDFRQSFAVVRQFRSPSASGPTVAGDDMKMYDVFRITNNSSSCVDVSVYVSSGTPTNMTDIYGKRQVGMPSSVQLWSSGSGQTASRVNLGNSSSGKNVMQVDVYWKANSVATAATFAIAASGDYTTTCP